MRIPFILLVLTIPLGFSGCETPAPPPPVAIGDVIAIADADTKPVAIQRVPPHFPTAERRAGMPGYAITDFIVTTEGRVAQARVIEASDNAFAAAALQAVSQWRFRPATRNGAPVACHMQVPIKFAVNNVGP
jgi:protein TonB